MASHYLRKYGVAATVDFELYKLDGTALKTDAASAAGDVTLYRDEANVETLDADAFVDEGAIYSLVLSIAEMTAKRIIVCIVDLSNPQVWLDKTLIVETYGDASAQHPFDLSTATQGVNVTQIGGVAQSATDLKDLVDTGYDPAAHKVQGVVLADTVTTCTTTTTNTDVTALAANYTAQRAGYIEELAAANIPTDLTNLSNAITAVDDFVDTEVTAIKNKTDLIGASVAPANEYDVQLDQNLSATQTAITNAITALNDIAASDVLAEAVDGAVTLKQALAVILAFSAGKSNGGGTANIKFRDVGDSKDRITATVDADGNRTSIAVDGA